MERFADNLSRLQNYVFLSPEENITKDDMWILDNFFDQEYPELWYFRGITWNYVNCRSNVVYKITTKAVRPQIMEMQQKIDSVVKDIFKQYN